jgi:hypothetical protein
MMPRNGALNRNERVKVFPVSVCAGVGHFRYFSGSPS